MRESTRVSLKAALKALSTKNGEFIKSDKCRCVMDMRLQCWRKKRCSSCRRTTFNRQDSRDQTQPSDIEPSARKSASVTKNLFKSNSGLLPEDSAN